MPIFGSSSGQQQVVSTEGVLEGTGGDEKKDEEEERLCCFGNSIYVNMYYAFLYCRQLIGSDYIINGSIMQLARPDDAVANVLICL